LVLLIESESTPNILYTDYAPYEWLFNHCVVVIHHGGAGTTAKALWSGIPQIVMPFTSDQPFWAERVHKLGLSLKPLSPKRFSVNKLVNYLELSLRDQDMIVRAQNIANKIRQENGLANAIEIIEAFKFNYLSLDREL
jgi:sterol 3beta-glucosyltransferase